MWSSSWWLLRVVKLTTIIFTFRRQFCRVQRPLLSVPSSSQIIIFPLKLNLIYFSKGMKGSPQLSTKFSKKLISFSPLCPDLLTINQSVSSVYLYILRRGSFFEHLVEFLTHYRVQHISLNRFVVKLWVCSNDQILSLFIAHLMLL